MAIHKPCTPLSQGLSKNLIVLVSACTLKHHLATKHGVSIICTGPRCRVKPLVLSSLCSVLRRIVPPASHQTAENQNAPSSNIGEWGTQGSTGTRVISRCLLPWKPKIGSWGDCSTDLSSERFPKFSGRGRGTRQDVCLSEHV
jgi:hypothetical protein